MKKPVQPPSLKELIAGLMARGTEGTHRVIAAATAGIGPAPNNEYRHWDILRHLEPPAGLTHEEWWLGIKLARKQLRRPLPLVSVAGEPFGYTMFDRMMWMLRSEERRVGQASVYRGWT